MTTTISGTSGITTSAITTDTSVANTSSTLTGESLTRVKLYTAKATTSGTTVDFSPTDGTGIPSWAKKITITFNGVSSNGTSPLTIYLGTTSGYENTSYNGSSSYVSGTNLCGVAMLGSTGINLQYSAAVNTKHGSITFTLISGNTWAFSGNLALSDNSSTLQVAGTKTVAATLDRIRVTSVNGTDLFDTGSVNILVEG